MNPFEKFRSLMDRFQSGEIPVEELPLNLEPLLWQASGEGQDEKGIRKIMNDLELVLFTLPAGEQRVAAAEVLEEARAFLSVSDLSTK